MQQWQDYSDKFAQLSMREQAMITVTGLVIIAFLLFSFSIKGSFTELAKKQYQNRQLLNDNRNIQNTISELQTALLNNPNERLRQQITQYKQQLTKIDQSLLALTSKLIDPMQMRQALEKLLLMQKGVKLISFEITPAAPLLTSATATTETATSATGKLTKAQVTSQLVEQSVLKTNQKAALSNNKNNSADEAIGLYRHTIKLKLKGSYFQLRDYLTQLESLPWKFFWEKFNYQLKEYPQGELEIEIYSLSLKQEFIGV